MTTKPQRIAKVIAASGLCSRREAERWIEAGRIVLNGGAVLTPATLVKGSDIILVDGEPLPCAVFPRLFAYYKPTGELVTEHDPQGRRTIYDGLEEAQKSLKKACAERMIPVGRLDLNSEGLLLLSTSPAVVSDFMHGDLPRVYKVRTFGQLTESHEAEIRAGLVVEGIRYAPAKITLEKATGRNCWYLLTLTEGKNREIRRIFEHFEVRVNRLIRLKYGDIKLGDLMPGEIKEVRL